MSILIWMDHVIWDRGSYYSPAYSRIAIPMMVMMSPVMERELSFSLYQNHEITRRRKIWNDVMVSVF